MHANSIGARATSDGSRGRLTSAATITVSPAPPGIGVNTSVSPRRSPASRANRSSIATVRGA